MSTSTSRSSTSVNAGREPFPGEAELAERLAEAGARRPAARDDRLRRRGPRRRRRRRRRAALRRRRDGEPDFGWMDAATESLAEHLHPGHPRLLRDHAAGRHHPHPLEADARGGLRPHRGPGLPPRLLARSGCSPAGSSPTCASTPSSSAASTEEGAAKAPRVLRGGARLRRAPRPRARPTASGTSARAEAAELAKLAETTYRDVNIGLANQFARFADEQRHRRARRSSRPATPSPTATSTARASPSAATASRSTRGCTCGTTPRRPSCARPARPTPAMPEYAVDAARGRLRRPHRRAGRWCSARPTAAA